MSAPRLPLRRSPLARSVATSALRLLGWRIEGEMPPLRKFVVVCAPHTSRWDLSLTLLAATASGVQVHWLGKHTLFRPPMGWLLAWLGGVPVERSGGKDTVPQIVRRFAEREDLALAISPEGAKRRQEWWRSGFWHVAVQAGVPLVVASLDWETRVCRVGPVIVPGDLRRDMDRIREALAHVVPRHPERFGPIRLRAEGDDPRE
jgi:1-acyl-sn-glycerol-3-phosphate acyltransferase